VSILIVNLWLGFPYMFLVTTGAIQAIPDDIQEAGRVDGAGVWQIFRHIKFPLLLVSVAPLLISSFAFNFNNFNLIYMLTGGGPASRTPRSTSARATSSSRWSTRWRSSAPSATTVSQAPSRSSSSCSWP
jgi:ABC-type sugar transport system permease subunit